MVRAGAQFVVQGLQVPMFQSSDPGHLLVLHLAQSTSAVCFGASLQRFFRCGKQFRGHLDRPVPGICWYFKPGKHLEVETRLFDRISANFVGLFSSLNPSRKDMSCKNLGRELPGKWCTHEP